MSIGSPVGWVKQFTVTLRKSGVAISLNGKGGWMDNVLIERLWLSVKCENDCVHCYDSIAGRRQGFWIKAASLTKTAPFGLLPSKHRTRFTSEKV